MLNIIDIIIRLHFKSKGVFMVLQFQFMSGYFCVIFARTATVYMYLYVHTYIVCIESFLNLIFFSWGWGRRIHIFIFEAK